MQALRNRKSNWFDVLNLLLVTLCAFLCLYPMYFILVNSLSDPMEVAKGVYLIPSKPTLDAYREVLKTTDFFNSVLVSVCRVIVGSSLSIFCSSLPAYILTYRELPARKLLYRVFICTMYVNAGFIPYYLTVTNLGLQNTFAVYVLPGAVSAYYIILIKTYIESIPSALHEAAELDGAGILSIYFRIILPLSKPILACIVVFAAVGQWNTWSDDMFFIRGAGGAHLHCLQYRLYMMLQSNLSASAQLGDVDSVAQAVKTTPTTLRMAMTFVTVLPILCVYPSMQRYFISGIMLGSVKG